MAWAMLLPVTLKVFRVFSVWIQLQICCALLSFLCKVAPALLLLSLPLQPGFSFPPVKLCLLLHSHTLLFPELSCKLRSSCPAACLHLPAARALCHADVCPGETTASCRRADLDEPVSHGQRRRSAALS